MMISKLLRPQLRTPILQTRTLSAISPTPAPSSNPRPRSSFDLPDPRVSMSYQNSLDYNSGAKWNPQLSKIVATIGPTSEQLEVLQDVVRCGMRVMRLNFSHATVEEVELRVKNLRACKVRLLDL
jgi:pyruvate kinase